MQEAKQKELQRIEEALQLAACRGGRSSVPPVLPVSVFFFLFWLLCC